MTAEHLLSPDKSINAPSSGEFDPTILLTPKFYNDLDVTSDGMVIFTDSSYTYHRSQNRVEVMDGAPRGRLLRYNLNSGVQEVLLCGLHFPNGVQLKFLSKNEVLVNELARFRILKVNTDYDHSNLSVRDCGEYGSLYQSLNHKDYDNYGVEVFTDSAPGIIDNIRADSLSSKYSIIGCTSKSFKPFSFLWTSYQLFTLRQFIGKFIPMEYVEKLVPKYGFVFVINNKNGDIVRTLHDTTGGISLLSEVQRHPITGDLWLGMYLKQLKIVCISNSIIFCRLS